MSTYVLLSEDEPIVDLVSQIESILNEPETVQKTKEGDVKSPSVNTPEEAEEEEEDEEEEKEKEENEKEKEEDEKEKSDEEEDTTKKKKTKKVKKEAPEPKPKEDSAWMTLAKENKTLEVLDQAFFPNFQKFLSTAESDSEPVFPLVFYILKSLAEKNKLDWRSRVTRLTTLFSTEIKRETKEENKESDQLLTQLKLFAEYYDAFSDDKHPDVRYAVFSSFLSFILWSKQTSHVIDNLTLSNYEKVVKSWKLTPVEQREFSLLLTKVHLDHQVNNNVTTPMDETQKHRIQYLKTWETVTKGDDIDKTTEQAVGAITQALLSNSLVEIHTLLALRAVTNLAKHKDHSRAHRLLTIFAKESCDAYEKFYKENPTYLSELGLNHKKLQSHIRTLTLCSLGVSSASLSYETLQKAFGVNSGDEVEEIVLGAVTEGRVEAKIDQEKSEVVIYRTSPRSFELSSWQSLSDQLEGWKENVSQVLSILQRAQQAQSQLVSASSSQ